MSPSARETQTIVLLDREKKLLSLLMKVDRKLTTTEIASELGVSTRTVKSDIKKINEAIKPFSCMICTKQSVGIWIEYDKAGKDFLIRNLHDQNSSMEPELRKYQVAALILLEKGYTSMEAIADRLFVSKGTIVNDIAELESFWTRFNLTFVKKVKYGIMVEGKDIQIRNALVYALKELGKKRTGIRFDKIREFLPLIDHETIRTVVENAEEEFTFVLSDFSRDTLILQIMVSIAMNQTDRSYDFSTDEISNYILEWKSGRAHLISNYLLKQLDDKAKIQLAAGEGVYFTICLQGLRYHVPPEREYTLQGLAERDPEKIQFMLQVCREVEEEYHVSLIEDEEMACALFDHLLCMMHRVRTKMFVINPMIKDLKKEMTYEYEIASYIVARFSGKYQLDPNEDEIGYITFYIGTLLEKLRQVQKRQHKVTIVCATGIATSQFIATKLQRVLPELECVGILSVSQTMNLRSEEQDFVISTVPLQLDSIPVIQITPVLNDSDVKRIRHQMALTEGGGQVQEKFPHLMPYLHNSISILNCDLKTKEEVILLLGNRMKNEGYVDEGYVESVFQRERVSETALGNLVAIPHAYNGHIIKPGIGLLTLQKPIPWGSEKVQIIFLLALDARSGADFRDLFTDVLDLTKDVKELEYLLKARKFNEISISGK